MKILSRLVLLSIFILLAGCSTSTTPTILLPTETHQPSPIPSPIPASPIPEPSPTPAFDQEKMNIVHTESVHEGRDILVEGVRIKDLVLATDKSVSGDALTFDPELGRDANGNLTLLKDFSMSETKVAREQVTKGVFYALYEAWKSPENTTPEDLALTRSKFGRNRENVSFEMWMAALKAYQTGQTYNGIGVDLNDIRVRIFSYDYTDNGGTQAYYYFDPTGPVRIVWTENWYQLQKYGKGAALGFGTFHRPDGGLGLVFNLSNSTPIRDDVFAECFIRLLKRIKINADQQKIDSKTQLDLSKIVVRANEPLEQNSCYNPENNVLFCGITPSSNKGNTHNFP